MFNVSRSFQRLILNILGYQDIRIKNLNRIVLTHLNINFLRSKVDLIADQIKSSVHVLTISEAKPDDSFPAGQFRIPGYESALRLDRNQNGGGSWFL